MLSSNEYSQLKSVIVGTARGARIPEIGIDVRTVNYADQSDISGVIPGPYPDEVLDQAEEDLETLVDFLKKENVEVFRPHDTRPPEYYFYCPRDTVLVTDQRIIAAPMPLRARSNEYKGLTHVLSKYGTVVTIKIVRSDLLYNEDCLGNPDVLALNEFEPAFDAANILRDNDDLYYLVSNTGNKKGAKRLQELLPKKRVHTIEGVYSYIHIDSTIALLREGLMLLNPSRIKSLDQLPEPLRTWDVIWCPEPVDIGHHPGICNASAWCNMNLLSVNPNLVILEERQTPTRLALEAKGIECAMLPMRQARTLGGCFHCVTLDIERV